jgi:NitT/TauT family transport system substrate-binding protein
VERAERSSTRDKEIGLSGHPAERYRGRSIRCRFGNGEHESLYFVGTLRGCILLSENWQQKFAELKGSNRMNIIATDRRRLLKSAVALGGLAAMGSLISVTKTSAQAPAKVRMQLGWLASNGLIGELVANKMGFYRDLGIDLEVVPGGPNVDGVAGVAAGQSTIGQVSSSPSIMLARSAGIPIKAFAAGYHTHPFTYFSLESDPIREPRDMIGKTIATQPTAFILARALLALHGIPESEVNLVNMGSDMNQLLTGQAQAVTGWLTNTQALAILGENRVDMRLWDTGIRLYANVYYTTDRVLEESHDVVENFVRGSARGWAYARDNQEEAVDILVSSYPNLDRNAELAAVRPVIGFSFGEATDADGWGGMNRENWKAQIDSYAALDQFQGNVPDIDDVMTLSVLKATDADRRG